MRRDLDATIARERELMECLGEACDKIAESGPAPWLSAQIDRLNRTLDALREERERPR